MQVARAKGIDIPDIVYQRRRVETVDTSKPTTVSDKKLEKMLETAERQQNSAFEREQNKEVNKVMAKKARKEKR